MRMCLKYNEFSQNFLPFPIVAVVGTAWYFHFYWLSLHFVWKRDSLFAINANLYNSFNKNCPILPLQQTSYQLNLKWSKLERYFFLLHRHFLMTTPIFWRLLKIEELRGMSNSVRSMKMEKKTKKKLMLPLLARKKCLTNEIWMVIQWGFLWQRGDHGELSKCGLNQLNFHARLFASKWLQFY